jgi:hypothetical protein
MGSGGSILREGRCAELGGVRGSRGRGYSKTVITICMAECLFALFSCVEEGDRIAYTIQQTAVCDVFKPTIT